ncbi:MAG: outer membrane beta-barrel protein, partial [Methylococcales bacterium]|nr:outer membrane beta-barrel protein [Methylococcales bacterium]
MKIQQKRTHYRMIQVATSGLLLAGFIANTHAGAIADLTGYDANETSLLKNNGIVVGGWANAGITYNSTNPANGFNGPVTFGDRDSEVQLNQLNLFIQRAVATEGSSWDFGGRFDVMFGTDSIFTQAYGVPGTDPGTGNPLNRGHWDLNFLGSATNRFYDLALPQAYAEAYIPIGNGLNVKAGHFYTPIGYETVPAPDNFFYTHAYTMQFGEPFTHT